jgi:hypothetical protein
VADGEIRWIGDLTRLEIKPGDKFVIQIDRRVDAETAASIQAAWASFTEGCEGIGKLLIIEPGMKLGTISTKPE